MSNRIEWQRQSDTLNCRISKAKANINTRASRLASSTTRQSNTLKTLADLLGCLQMFAEEHYIFFRDLFFDADGKKSDQTCSKFPPEYVFSVIFDQISFDLTVITQVANQRLASDAQDLAILEKADEIALRALQPVMAHFQLQGTRVVTYFKKDTSIRVIPYASVALIGIPYTAAKISRGLLAIPHEMGHYLYWHGTLANGRTLQEELSDKINKRPVWRFRWLEETFADIYGCLIAGPAIALSFQDLQMRNTPAEFVDNDEDHPVPILRPNIYTKVLAEDFGNWMPVLDKRWNGTCEKTGKRRERTSENEFKHRNGTYKDVAEAMTDVGAMVAEILPYLTQAWDEEASTWWHDYLQSGTDVDTLYPAFADHVKTLTLPEAPCSLPTLSHPDFATLRAKWLKQGQRLKDAPAWLPVLNAGGWAIRGPQCEGTGTCD